MKALIVDSSHTMRSAFQHTLSTRGFEGAEANDCQRAMDVLHAMGAPDLVLVDRTLRAIDGLEFVTRLRQESADGTKVVMLAVSPPGMRDLQGALMAGADDCLMKPFTSFQLDARLAQAGLTCHL